MNPSSTRLFPAEVAYSLLTSRAFCERSEAQEALSFLFGWEVKRAHLLVNRLWDAGCDLVFAQLPDLLALEPPGSLVLTREGDPEEQKAAIRGWFAERGWNNVLLSACPGRVSVPHRSEWEPHLGLDPGLKEEELAALSRPLGEEERVR